jgi:putative membrane protein
MNLVRTVAPSMLLTLLLACGGDDSKQARAPQTTAGETSAGATTTTTPSTGSTMGSNMGSNGMNSGTSGSSMTGTGSMGNDTTGTSGSTGSMGSTSGTSGSSMGTTGSAGTDTSTTYTDAEIAAITAAINTGEVEEAKAAQKKAKDPKVKAFATKMVNHHTSANTKQADLLKKLKMSTDENAKSRELSSEASSNVQTLSSQTGAEFDRAFMDQMVKDHQKALSMLDDKLIPEAKSSELKQMLQSVRSTVDSHLREAMNIQKSLASK